MTPGGKGYPAASCCSRPRPRTADPEKRSAPGCRGPACGRARQKALPASAGTAPAPRKWAHGADPAGNALCSRSSFPPSLFFFLHNKKAQTLHKYADLRLDKLFPR